MKFSFSSYVFVCWLVLFTCLFRPTLFASIASKVNEGSLQTVTENHEELFNKKIAPYLNEVNLRLSRLSNQLQDYQRHYEELKKAAEVINSSGLDKLVSDSAGRSISDRHYMYKDAIIHQEVFEALNQLIIQKIGNPGGWDESSYKVNPWNQRKILKIGNGEQTDGNGISVVIPEEYNVVWFRVLNDRWTVFRAKFLDGEKENIGKFACGYRCLNEICPDGTTPDTMHRVHMWCQISTRRAGKLGIYSEKNSDSWISGVGFSKNLWNHTRNSAVAYHWAINGGTASGWSSENWNSDQLAFLTAGQNLELRVPVIPSNQDKLVYIVEHNSAWLGTMHAGVWVNGVPIERFRTTYDNPFSRHYNSKFYDKYIAARIPANLIKSEDTFITLRVDMTFSDNHLHFREIGTHDLANY